ncbi:MAG TPA: nucleoside-diphosphate kinase [Dehalococcoidia bacterium]|jgi:nucleoside-diphosphate kinase|nr:nucleoside-diphosphate kinase [Dehalococcoidia bacterium]
MERTLILIKPDGMQRGISFEVLSRFEKRGLRLAGLRLLQVSRELAEDHYGEHLGKPFFEGLVAYITSSPIIAAVFEGTDAVSAARSTMGGTKPVDAAPGTIRGDYGLEIGRNVVHGSDSPESAEREISIFFGDNADVISWSRDVDSWVFE